MADSESGEAFDRQALRQLFDSCDSSGSGYISKQDLIDGCRRLSLDDLTPEDVDVLFSKLAVDESHGKGSERRVSFDAFAERFSEWAAAQQGLPQQQQQQHLQEEERQERRHTPFLDDGESFTDRSAPQMAVSGPGDGEMYSLFSTLTALDLSDLARKYDADTSGVSLRRALTDRWRLTDIQAQDVTDCLNYSMREDKVTEVIAASLRDIGYTVIEERALVSGLPTLVVEPLQPADGSMPPPSHTGRRSSSFRNSPHRERRPTMSRKASLGDANIGELKQ